MTRRFGNLLVVFSLILSVGLQWTFVQSVAWVGMAIDYSDEMSFSAAVEKAIGGKESCQLCRLAHEQQQEEQDRDNSDPSGKIKLFAEGSSLILAHPDFLRVLPAPSRASADPSRSPLKMPPRAA